LQSCWEDLILCQRTALTIPSPAPVHFCEIAQAESSPALRSLPPRPYLYLPPLVIAIEVQCKLFACMCVGVVCAVCVSVCVWEKDAAGPTLRKWEYVGLWDIVGGHCLDMCGVAPVLRSFTIIDVRCPHMCLLCGFPASLLSLVRSC